MISLKNFCPIRQGKILYKNIDCTCLPGSITVIMGKSGIGKTSLLESIRGDCVHEGSVETVGKIFSIWQSNNQLFPWFSVKQNLNLCNSLASHEYTELSRRWGLGHLLSKKPLHLSGGQQQRFILIMAMCSGRENLLCDEPLSSVDRPTAMEIAKDFREEAKRKNQSIIWITHDEAEANILADDLIRL